MLVIDLDVAKVWMMLVIDLYDMLLRYTYNDVDDRFRWYVAKVYL